MRRRMAFSRHEAGGRAGVGGWRNGWNTGYSQKREMFSVRLINSVDVISRKKQDILSTNEHYGERGSDAICKLT